MYPLYIVNVPVHVHVNVLKVHVVQCSRLNVSRSFKNMHDNNNNPNLKMYKKFTKSVILPVMQLSLRFKTPPFNNSLHFKISHR